MPDKATTRHAEDFRAKLSLEVESLERESEARSAQLLTWPVTTSHASMILERLGYDGSHANRDYCTRHAKRIGFKAPKARRGDLSWTRENLIDFAMQLERMRAWLPGRHDERKTCFELDADAAVFAEFTPAWETLASLPASKLLDAAAGFGAPETVAVRSVAASLYLTNADLDRRKVEPRLRAALEAVAENRESTKLRTLLATLRAELRKVKR